MNASRSEHPVRSRLWWRLLWATFTRLQLFQLRVSCTGCDCPFVLCLGRFCYYDHNGSDRGHRVEILLRENNNCTYVLRVYDSVPALDAVSWPAYIQLSLKIGRLSPEPMFVKQSCQRPLSALNGARFVWAVPHPACITFIEALTAFYLAPNEPHCIEFFVELWN